MMKTREATERLAAAATAVAVTLTLLAGIGGLADHYARMELESPTAVVAARNSKGGTDLASRGNAAAMRCAAEPERTG